ncbi:hypothetical protein [Legionella shakespearei]|uniref:Uncharacterized protein n=1 Tax=Legionella shakespearei DSM 23087 TaxID=1122169 RepID=A0A0W0YHV9_9GAMM|nr:hypothetical protein [Legionella shakespearei]KTD56485.1 hypothetical protein Lsha_2884 [Legionella shakespearei DSM 23087]
MMRLSILITLLLLLLPWQTAAAADSYPKAAITEVINCYNNAVNKEDEAVKCIHQKVNEIPNPLDYHITIRTSDPDKLGQMKIKIFMINNTGYMVYCNGKADKQMMTVTSCATDQGEPPSAAQSMSIDSLLQDF